VVYTVVPRARTREQLNGRGEVCAQGARTFRFGTTQLYFSARVQQCSAHAAKQYGQIVSFSFFFYLTGQTGNPPATDSFLVSRPVDAHLADTLGSQASVFGSYRADSGSNGHFCSCQPRTEVIPDGARYHPIDIL
jgi:hypothetical protein